jgi:hypothetical protein
MPFWQSNTTRIQVYLLALNGVLFVGFIAALFFSDPAIY